MGKTNKCFYDQGENKEKISTKSCFHLTAIKGIHMYS